MISIPLSLTGRHDCSYLSGKTAQTAFVHPSFPLDVSIYSRLIEQGFRRSGNDVYTPHCPGCRLCIPVRLEVNAFEANRRQKRCLKKNQETTATIKPAAFDQSHFALYQRYQNRRHAGSSMAQSGPEEYTGFLVSSWCETVFVEFRIENALAAVAVVDRLDNALSAVYTFFAPEFASYSPGTYAVLWQIEYAKTLGLNRLYLGYWIENCRKMSYKAHYRPLYGFVDQQWSRIDI